MKPSRRRFVAGAAALAALPILPACKGEPSSEDTGSPPDSAPDRSPEPPPWEAPGQVDATSFPTSIQAGDATPDGILLSVLTSASAVTLVVVEADGEGWTEIERQTIEEVDRGVQVELTGLKPDTPYRYAFYADETRRSPVGRFRTAPAPGSLRKIVFGATSCLGGANPGWANLSHVAPAELDFFLLLGDTVYADGSVTLADYRAEWDFALSVPSLAETCASTSIVAAWDDHEVDNNWYLDPDNRDSRASIVDPVQLEAATTAFREALPQRDGAWRSLRWGDALELFVMDCRGERDGKDHMVSEEQLTWVTEAIQSSQAAIKILLSSIHLTDHTKLFGAIEEQDRWQGYPAQRQALIDALLATPGVLVITGDMHYGAIQHVGQPDSPAHALIEVAAGPSGSVINSLVSLAQVPEQYPVLLAEWSWCRFEADPARGEVLVQFIGDDGSILAEQLLSV